MKLTRRVFLGSLVAFTIAMVTRVVPTKKWHHILVHYDENKDELCYFQNDLPTP